MNKLLILLISLAAAAAVTACGVERTSTVLGPSKIADTASVASSTSSVSTSSFLGTWVIQNPRSTSAVTPGSVSPQAITTLPDLSSCSNFQWAITSQTATDMSGKFSADCAGGISINGTITGQVSKVPIPILLSGTMT